MIKNYQCASSWWSVAAKIVNNYFKASFSKEKSHSNLVNFPSHATGYSSQLSMTPPPWPPTDKLAETELLQICHHISTAKSHITDHSTEHFLKVCEYGYPIWTTDLGFLKWGDFGSAIAHLQGCFHPWNFFQNIGLNMLLWDSFMSNKCSQLGHSTGMSGLATDCPRGVLCCGWTTCFL